MNDLKYTLCQLLTIPCLTVIAALIVIATTRAQSALGAPTAKSIAANNLEHWATWGGPGGDFRVAMTNLANAWPEGGPPRLWSRPLGDGYSGIAEENGILYTAYRRETDDVVTALDAKSGKTIWETGYAAAFKNAYSEAVGPGPYAMPQVVGERL